MHLYETMDYFFMNMALWISHFSNEEIPKVLYLTRVLLPLHVCACAVCLFFSPVCFWPIINFNITGSAQLGFLVILLLKLGKCPFIFTRYLVFTIFINTSFRDLYSRGSFVEYIELVFFFFLLISINLYCWSVYTLYFKSV